MPKWLWIERDFNFDFPANKFPDLLERHRGTPVRLDALTAGLADEITRASDGQGWSIKENIGHLIDLCPMTARRLEQLIAGEPTLVGADMGNQKTAEANHNGVPLEELLLTFRTERFDLTSRLERLGEADWAKVAMHPRLSLPMRVADLVYFDSEHDDYHLARIRELVLNLCA